MGPALSITATFFFFIALPMVLLVAFFICKDLPSSEKKKIAIAILVALIYGGVCCLMGLRPPGLSFGRFI